MKKFLALLLSLLFTLTVAASAEEWTHYTNADLGYSLDVPGDWIILDKDSASAIVDAVNSGEMNIEGVDLSSLSAYAQQVEQVDMTMFMAPGGMCNVNVVAQQVGMDLTAQMLMSMVPSTVEQMKSVFPDYQLMADAQVLAYGDTEYCSTAGTYTVMDQPMLMAQAYVCQGGVLYVFTFTVMLTDATDMETLDAQFDQMLTTFAVAEA